MILSNANKALLITILLASSLVLMAFNIHISKTKDLMAETYFEILPEEEELLKEIESLEDILESFNSLKTNKAFNENKTNEDFEDDEFKETMEKLNSRHESKIDSEEKEFEALEPENTEAFDEINKLIESKKNNEGSNENSSISYSLVNRNKIHIPPPIYLCEESGKIVINIIVNAQGKVIETYYNESSTSNNGCLIDHALEYAKASTFNADASKPEQLGTITFIFRGKR
ncbi:MAG: hypothetical protein HKO92_10910 [Flavobacteriaceae bacterium]|nr:hypothetical protein [Bacteroidia bacterium]NNK83622.1 hypothetical protein [Flavobacteriaceae bacterium]